MKHNPLSCLIALSFLLLFSCNKEENGDVAPAELISSITVAPQAGNALRTDIRLSFNKAVSYQVEYWQNGDESSLQTTALTGPVTSDKCTLLFMKAQTEYCFRVLAHTDSQSTRSEVYKFTTGVLPAVVPSVSVLTDEMPEQLPGYILITKSNETPGSIVITDTEGETLWYQILNESLSVATFDPKTNTIACIVGKHPTQLYTGSRILVMDLFGNTLLDKEVPELLIHHEIKRLPDGDLLMVHYTPKKFDLTAQGGDKEQTVYGDGLLVMDMKGNIKWEWDCFEEMNPADDPKIMDGIPMLNLRYCDDWLHANSADMDEEGNFYITFNWLSQMWKIDAKTKKVVYRLGDGGNVDIPSDAIPAGLHCVTASSKNHVLLFDNGLTSHHSRGLVFDIDAAAGKASVANNIVLPSEYSSQFQGSVYPVNDNLYMFGPTLSSAILFTDSEGTIVRILKTSNQSYRAEYIAVLDVKHLHREKLVTQ